MMSNVLLKVAEFRHLCEFYSFNRENKGYGKRSTQTEVTVCVVNLVNLYLRRDTK